MIDMSNSEKKIIKTISEAIKNMSEFERGYLLGVVESRANMKEEAECKKDGEICRLANDHKV